MTDNLVTHADLDALALIEGAVNIHSPGMAARALVAKLIAAAEADQPPVWEYRLTDSPKMLRESLCVAQAAISNHPTAGGPHPERHVARLGRLIDECDRHRPLGVGGKHNDLHTATCGCEGHCPTRLTPLRPTVTAEDVEKAAYAIFREREGVRYEGCTRDAFLGDARAAFAAAGIEVRDVD